MARKKNLKQEIDDALETIKSEETKPEEETINYPTPRIPLVDERGVIMGI